MFLSGLENGTRLTAGTPLGSKGWRISARDLGSVMAYAPSDYIGAMHAAINLHAANNTVVDTRVVRLEWMPKSRTAANAAAAHRAARRRPVVAVPPAPQLDQEEIGRLIKRGQQLLATGDIAPARLLLQRAAARRQRAGRADRWAGPTIRTCCAKSACWDLRRTRPRPASGTKRPLELGASEASRRLDRLAQANARSTGGRGGSIRGRPPGPSPGVPVPEWNFCSLQFFLQFVSIRH